VKRGEVDWKRRREQVRAWEREQSRAKGRTRRRGDPNARGCGDRREIRCGDTVEVVRDDEDGTPARAEWHLLRLNGSAAHTPSGVQQSGASSEKRWPPRFREGGYTALMSMEGRTQRAVARVRQMGPGDGSQETAQGHYQGRDPGPTGRTGDGPGCREAEPGGAIENL